MKIHVWLTIVQKIYGAFHEDLNKFMISRRILPKMKQNQNTHFMPNTFFLTKMPFKRYEKYGRPREARLREGCKGKRIGKAIPVQA